MKKLHLVISRAVPGAARSLAEEIEETGLELIGVIPDDPPVTKAT